MNKMKRKKSKESRQKQKNQKWITVMMYTLTGGVCGVAGIGLLEKIIGKDAGFGEMLYGLAGIIVIMYFSMFIQIIIHELGHLVFGLLTGYQFASFRIGSLMFVKKEGKIRLKKYSLMGTGGQCLMIPPEMKNGTIPYRLYNLGGVIFNLVFGGIGVGLFLLLKDNLLLQMFFILFATVGMAFAITNGIPIHAEIDNDGANACSLGKNQEALRCFWIQMKINALLTEEVRLKDMPEEWFRIPSEEDMRNNMLCTAVGVFACSRAMDQKDFKSAREMAEELLKKDIGLSFLYKEILTSELCFCELIEEKRAEILNQLMTKDFERFAKAMSAQPSLLRMQYAYELLEKQDKEAAKKKLEQFEKAAKNYPHACEIEGERELIEVVQKRYAEITV